jgi:hypothetical protein
MVSLAVSTVLLNTTQTAAQVDVAHFSKTTSSVDKLRNTLTEHNWYGREFDVPAARGKEPAPSAPLGIVQSRPLNAAACGVFLRNGDILPPSSLSKPDTRKRDASLPVRSRALWDVQYALATRERPVCSELPRWGYTLIAFVASIVSD